MYNNYRERKKTVSLSLIMSVARLIILADLRVLLDDDKNSSQCHGNLNHVMYNSESEPCVLVLHSEML